MHSRLSLSVDADGVPLPQQPGALLQSPTNSAPPPPPDETPSAPPAMAAQAVDSPKSPQSPELIRSLARNPMGGTPPTSPFADDPALTAASEPIATTTGDPAEAAYYDSDRLAWVKAESLRAGVTRVYPYAVKGASALAAMGEVLATGMGLTESRYQYAVDEYYKRSEQRAQRREVARQEQLAKRRSEGGGKVAVDGNMDESAAAAAAAAPIVERLPYAPPLSVRRRCVGADFLGARQKFGADGAEEHAA